MSLPSIASLLDKRTIDHIADYAKDWAQVNGICVRLNDQAERSDLARIQAFTIAPSYVPYNLYHQAYGLQKDFGLLYHRIPFDHHFMKNTLSRVLETDHFTKRLFDIYDEVFDTMHRIQPHVLTIQRADYMFHLTDDRQNGHTKEVLGEGNDCSSWSSKYVLKQVEVNTMASGAAGIACKVAQLHDKVLKRYCSNAMTSSVFKIKGRLAENRAIENVAKAIVEAWRCYKNKDAAIIFVVEGVDLNAMDQRLTEYMITDLEDNIKIYRLTLKQCYYQLKLDNNMKLKFKDNETEVAVVYFRSGYSPHQYPTEHEWEARRAIEKSAAIKCPWIGAQLAGSKKIQQVLTDYRELAKFQPDNRTCDNMMDTFAKIYSLDSDNTDRESLLNKVRKNPHGFVLKEIEFGMDKLLMTGKQIMTINNRIQSNVLLPDGNM